MKTLAKVLLAVLILVLTTGAPLPGQSDETRGELTREEELYRLDMLQANLDLKQAKVEMDKAQVELEQVRLLFDEKLQTIEKLNEAKQKHDQAVIRYEQARIELDKKRLEFLKGATLITVVDAQKDRNEDGDIIARITIRNDSDINKARIAMDTGEPLSDDRLASLLRVDNVVVSLSGDVQLTSGQGENIRSYSSGKAIVCDPYHQIVPELLHGQQKTLEYRLLRKDLENVTVCLEFLGTKKEYDVFLKKESKQDLPDISSTQYSQIGQLGSEIWYDLNLERLAKSEQSFSLVVINLPPEIPFAFRDPASKAMLTQVKFTEELSKQSLYFEVSLPEKLKTELVDANISFYILVTHQSELKNIFEVRKKYGDNIPPEEVLKLKGNKVELILIPRGVGKLELIVPNLFKEVEQAEPVEIKFNVLNSGTLALRRVTPELDLPLDWEGELSPTEAEVIDAGAKVLFKANIRPAADVAVGEYTVRIKAEGYSGVEVVEALDKDFTIRVAAKGNITGTAILVGLLVVLVIGIAIASIKVSRR